jgi:hypothetical protein
MKRRSDLSRRYMIYRSLPFFEPTEESEDINIDTRMILKVMTLVKPEVRFTEEKVLRIIQKIPKERRKNEFWIKDSLEKEACRLFESFHPKEIKIEFSYE